MMSTIIAITSRIWMRPPTDAPPIPPMNPKAHNTIKIKIIVQSIVSLPESYLSFVSTESFLRTRLRFAGRRAL